jgi:hypothetical protein
MCWGKKTPKPSDSEAPADPPGTIQKTCAQPCKAYDSVDGSKDIESYNCAGLAHRTYTFIGDVNTVKAMLAKGTQTACSSNCGPCQVKHWLWEYDMHFEDADGNNIGDSPRDFHTVAGACDASGNDPTNVVSKNGARPLVGPGTGPSFRPPEREQATKSNRYATPIVDSTGRPIYKVRTNYTETCYCLPCPT